MAYEGPQLTIPGLVAGADLSAATNQFRFVKLSAARTVVLCSAITDRPIGVLQNRPQNGEAATVCALGVSKVRGDANLANADLIGTSADGEAAAVTPGTSTTVYIAGQVIEDNGAAGGLITAAVNCLAPARAA
jgi:hypothetical protein